MSPLFINCFILGEDSSKVFTVEIPKNRNVSILKDLIKQKKFSHLNHVVASDLIVWKVSLPVDIITPELTVNDVEACDKLHNVKRISSIFDKALVDEHVHILVEAPTAPDPAQLLSLNCSLRVDGKLKRFIVMIPKDHNVGVLKSLIKAEQSPRLNHVVASDLMLSQVSLPLGSDLEESLKNVEFIPLEDSLPLSQVFPRVENDHLHIVVETPPNEGLGTKSAREEERRDQIPALHKRFQNIISRILKAETPVDLTKSSNYTVAYSIYNGRYKANSPRTSVAPPIQLFHPAFGHFLDDMKSNHALPDNLICQTTEYMKEAAAIYESEDTRRKVLKPRLSAILNVNIQAIHSTILDGVMEMAKNMSPFLIFLQEDRFGDGGLDILTQAGLSAGRCWAQPRYKALRNATACPTFLMATTGPWIAILGAVITDSVIVQRLTDYIWVGLDSVLNESHITHVARTFCALKTSLKKLSSCYENLDPTGDLPADSRYFPSITAYRSRNGELVKFRYAGFLENCPDCITLRAQTEMMPAQDIVVKFVERYGQRAHQILADKGLAPKLLYCGSPCLDDDGPSYQSISMVVMEYVDGNTFDVEKRNMSKESAEEVQSTVMDALELLHRDRLVYGDLRPPNIMITKDRQVKLIDFNWAGEEGQAKYPPLISPNIAWPEGVKALAVMWRKHDSEMLRKLI